MKIVIDIPEKVYNALTHTEFNANLVVDEMRKAIANGTPFPKNHGRIIDESKITSVYYHEETYKSTVRNYHTVIDGTDAPTIIEADKEK